MSDDPSILASTVLSSLLGGALTSPSEMVPVQSDDNALSGIASESPTFKQLMQSNIDADGASFARFDDASIDTAPLNGQGISEKAALVSTGMYTAQAQLASGGSIADTQESGGIRPAPGNLLPPDARNGNTGVSLVDHLFVSKSNTAHSLSTTENSISASIDAVAALNEPIDSAAAANIDAAADIDADPAVETQLAISAQPQQAPIGSIAPEQGGGRTRELSETLPGSTSQSPGLDATSETPLDGNSEFTRGGNGQDQPAENPFDTRASRSMTAEFALNDGPESPLTNLTFARGGESGPGALSALAQLTGANPTVTPSSLTLVGDRQAAGQQVAQHVASFVRQGDEYVEIILTPPSLGKISARIELQNEQATIVFSAPSAETREIIEASLPRLSSLLEEAGLTLADANVESQAQKDDSQTSTGKTSDSDAFESSNDAPSTSPQKLVRGLLDAYA